MQASLKARLVCAQAFSTTDCDGEPHGLFATAKERLTTDLMAFLRA